MTGPSEKVKNAIRLYMLEALGLEALGLDLKPLGLRLLGLT